MGDEVYMMGWPELMMCMQVFELEVKLYEWCLEFINVNCLQDPHML